VGNYRFLITLELLGRLVLGVSWLIFVSAFVRFGEYFSAFAFVVFGLSSIAMVYWMFVPFFVPVALLTPLMGLTKKKDSRGKPEEFSEMMLVNLNYERLKQRVWRGS
jgi:hypothetical protein